MHLDRWTKVVLSVSAVALTALAAHVWLERLTPGRADAQTTMPKYEISLPKSWGKIVNFSNNNFLMESSDGTLRIIDVDGKSPEYPKIKVQIRWQ